MVVPRSIVWKSRNCGGGEAVSALSRFRRPGKCVKYKLQPKINAKFRLIRVVDMSEQIAAALGRSHCTSPFGGVGFILFGDYGQLPKPASQAM